MKTFIAYSTIALVPSGLAYALGGWGLVGFAWIIAASVMLVTFAISYLVYGRDA